MKKTETNEAAAPKNWLPTKRTLKSLGNIVILLVVFWLGVSFGDGRFMLHSAVASNKNLPENFDYADVERVYDLMKDNYDGKLTTSQLMDGLKNGLVNASGDPHTEYFNSKDAKALNSQLSGTSFGGIGARLGNNDQGQLIVETPLPGYPAEKAGIQAKDIILAINGKDTTNMSTQAAVKLIQGKAGTTVTLQIQRGDTPPKNYAITRDNIKIPNVNHEILPGNIGYLQLVQFSTDSDFVNQVQQAAEALQQAHVKGVVLDLRGNPGGSLDAAVRIASMWLPEGKTVLQEKRDGKVVQTYQATGNPIFANTKTAVLIDEGSASASEILAGALKDNNVATLVGAKSYGKGSVQQIIDLRDGSELKVTIAHWYRPNGQNIDKKGIQPDKAVSISDDDIKNGHDTQKDAAVQIINQ